uniref:Post-glycosylphosphatidylinositol attachment to proteins 6 n=1 Tax=Sphaeramia orbicularis TaxID=375764 RepID=A0A672YQC6_9TELE
MTFDGLIIFSVFSSDGQVTFVSELSSKPAQKLSKYGWYGNVRLQRFHIPEETAVARWVFTVTKGHSFHCAQHNVTIHIRWGAPPVINPVGSVFPNNTLWTPCVSLKLPVTSHSSTTFNFSSPAPGDWYIAAHLPEDDGRIEQKGFPSCSYFFQPQLSIRRAVDTPVLHQALFVCAYLYIYVWIHAFFATCILNVSLSVHVQVVRSRPLTVNCSGIECSATLANPPWDAWLQVVVESNHDNRTVAFSIVSNYTGNHSHIRLYTVVETIIRPSKVNKNSASLLTPLSASACVWNIPVLYEEVDVLSLRFTPVNGPNVSVTDTHPTLLSYPLQTLATGGTLNLQLTLNTVSTHTVAQPLWDECVSLCFSFDTGKALFGGYIVHVNTSVSKAVIRLPFPQSTTWYLTLQLTCNSDCGNTSVVSVVPEVFISACVEDCGKYGECRLLRSYTYLYAACVCKAGWSGWGCTDDSKAQSYRRQLTATLLLTFSNLFFLPAIVVAVKRGYITEASVYLFTMFFSTFYHACDQPGVAVLCIMNYDTLQYCDFLGSVCSFWVTILCMARIRDTFKYTLFMLGALLLAMSMQLDRKGLWNMLGPILCAVTVMVTAWVYRGVKRHHCYPPSWQRWVFFLLPGALCALIGVSVFIFAETEDNYYYTHSLWHILVAACVVFLLPPREKSRESWRPRVCGYTLCQSSKDELCTVT